MEKMPIVEEKPPEEKIEPQEEKINQVEEKQEEEKLRKISGQAAFEMMYEERSIFPPEIQAILENKKSITKLTPEEHSVLQLERNRWWKEKFGYPFAWVFRTEEEKTELKQKRKERKKERKKENLQRLKIKIMEDLILALKNLDNGKPVEQFRGKNRMVLYFDEDKNSFFVFKNRVLKYLGMGDVLSDYAWRIKYAPDGEMIKPKYRIAAKNILVNEARRDLENLHDVELQRGWLREKALGRATLPKKFKKSSRRMGTIAEVMARELMSRISKNNDLDFIAERANVLEDSLYKYDFKIRSRKKRRGVGVGDKKI